MNIVDVLFYIIGIPLSILFALFFIAMGTAWFWMIFVFENPVVGFVIGFIISMVSLSLYEKIFNKN